MNNKNDFYEDEYDTPITDEQYRELIALRGGCSCHINPPCSNCSDPMTIEEAKELGIIEE